MCSANKLHLLSLVILSAHSGFTSHPVSFGPSVEITSIVNQVTSIALADFDGDGWQDLLSTSSLDNKTAIYYNTGNGSFASQKIISTTGHAPKQAIAVDVTGNGWFDVAVISSKDDKLAWYENHGNGTFSLEKIIAANPLFPLQLVASDLSNDGLDDLIMTSQTDGELVWLQNEGGGTFGPEKLINKAEETGNFIVQVVPADINNDGRNDLVAAKFLDGGLGWLERRTGILDFQDFVRIGDFLGVTMAAADVNSDGLVDVVGVSYSINEVHYWYENLGAGQFGPQRNISVTSEKKTSIVLTADFTGNGFPDIVTASDEDGKVSFYENLGDGTFAPQMNISESGSAARAFALCIGDVNGDGALDIVVGFAAKIVYFPQIPDPSPVEIFDDSAVKRFEFLGFIIVGSVAVFSGLIVILGYFFRRKNVSANGNLYSFANASLAAVVVTDFTSDIVFAWGLFVSTSSYRFISLIFLIVPMFLNVLMIFWMFRNEFKTSAMDHWFVDNDGAAIMIVILALSGTDVLFLMHSNLFGLKIFDAPASEKLLQRLTYTGLISNIFEDVPQLAVQLILLFNGSTNIILFIAFPLSILGVLRGLLRRGFHLMRTTSRPTRGTLEEMRSAPTYQSNIQLNEV
uniref:VCBS repeat-containing protein n=1 Tax=Hirondellea gigas TaxID=1518452 RepID=A0A6A7FMN7_9CRUS